MERKIKDIFRQTIKSAPESTISAQVFKYDHLIYSYNIKTYQAQLANNLPKYLFKKFLNIIANDQDFSKLIKKIDYERSRSAIILKLSILFILLMLIIYQSWYYMYKRNDWCNFYLINFLLTIFLCLCAAICIFWIFYPVIKLKRLLDKHHKAILKPIQIWNDEVGSKWDLQVVVGKYSSWIVLANISP